MAQKLGINHGFADPNQLTTHPDVDLVIVLPPAPQHARFVRAAIAAGKVHLSVDGILLNHFKELMVVTVIDVNPVRFRKQNSMYGGWDINNDFRHWFPSIEWRDCRFGV